MEIISSILFWGDDSARYQKIKLSRPTPPTHIHTTSEVKMDTQRIISNVMRMYNNDVAPEIALLWEMIRGQHKRFPHLFKADCKPEEGYINVRVDGLCAEDFPPVLRMTLVPDNSFRVAQVTTIWKKKTITLLTLNRYKHEPSPGARPPHAYIPAPVSATPPPTYFQPLPMMLFPDEMLPPPGLPPPAPIAELLPPPPPPTPTPGARPPHAYIPAPAAAPPPPPPAKKPKTPALSDDRVREIRKYKADHPGLTAKAVAEHFNVEYNTCAHLLSRKTYKNVV